VEKRNKDAHLHQCFVSGFVVYGSRAWNFFQSGSGQKKLIFSKAITKFWLNFLFSTQKVGTQVPILFLFSTNQVGILLHRELFKISENHEKFVDKVDFYCSISLPGSGFGIRIRILNTDPDPAWQFESGSTLIRI